MKSLARCSIRSSGLVCLFTTLLITLTASAEPSATPPSMGPALAEQANIPVTDHGAEVLYALSESSLESDGHWRRQVYHSIRINTLEAARDYGRLRIPFNHYYSNTELDFARVRAASGKLSDLAEDAVQVRVTGGGQDFYSDSSELVFSLPDIAPGSIIEFQFSQQSKELAFPELYSDRVMPHWFQEKVGNDGWRADFVHNFRFEFTSPAGTDIHTRAFSGFSSNPDIRRNEGREIRVWRMSDLAPFYPEAWMHELREVAPILKLSTLTDWSKVDAWTWENAADKLRPTEELEAVIAGFGLPENASREERIRAVYEYVQTNIRYVFAHLGRGGYEPHFANEVLNANYGDCKDQTIVAVALLRMLGIEAYPALVETASEGRSETSLVSLIFDHMLVYIPGEGSHDPVWMDTTGDRSLYPGMSNYLKGQTALIVDGNGGELTSIETGFADNYAHLSIRYLPASDNELRAEVNLELSGFFEQNIRSWWIHNNDRETGLKSFLSSIFSNSLDYTLEGDVHNHANLWQPVYMTGTFIFRNPDEDFDNLGASFTQINNLFGSFNSMQVPETRKNGYLDVTEWSLQLTTRVEGGEGVLPTLVGSAEDMNTPYFSLKQRGFADGDDYVVEMRYHKPAHDLTREQYRDYYAQLAKLNQVGSWLVNLQSVPEDESLTELERIREESGEKSFKYQLALAEHRMDQGEFESALAPALKAVELNNDSGKAWHVLGMAQGFNSLIDESIKSFEQAEALGYLP